MAFGDRGTKFHTQIGKVIGSVLAIETWQIVYITPLAAILIEIFMDFRRCSQWFCASPVRWPFCCVHGDRRGE